MGLNRKKLVMKECANCGQKFSSQGFIPTFSPFFPDSHSTICKNCLNELVADYNGEWSIVDGICRWLDYPFVPDQFTKVYDANPQEGLSLYCALFEGQEHPSIQWDEYYEKYKKIVEDGDTAKIHPKFDQEAHDLLVKRWGKGYDNEEYHKLESMYKGIEDTFGIGDVTKETSAIQMAKLSLEIDKSIINNGDTAKLIGAYEKVQKLGGFTSENATDSQSIQSVSELIYYLEQLGWPTKYHNSEPNDIVDKTMDELQKWTRNLWESESSLPDIIESQLESKRQKDEEEYRQNLIAEGREEVDIDDIKEDNLPARVDEDIEDEKDAFDPEV